MAEFLTKCNFTNLAMSPKVMSISGPSLVTYVAMHVNTNYADYGNLWPNFQQNAILLIWLYLLMLCEYLSHL